MDSANNIHSLGCVNTPLLLLFIETLILLDLSIPAVGQ